MVIIDDIQYTYELSSETTTWLLGNKYSKVICQIDFTIDEKTVATTSNPLVFGSSAYPTTDYIDAGNFPRFLNFRNGDQIRVTSTTSNNADYTIIDKVSDYLVRVDTTLTNESSDSGAIQLITPMQGIRYRWGIIENNAAINFNSKIDGSEQRLVYENYSTASTSQVNMEFEGATTYQLGGATLERLTTGTDPGDQQFRITHTFYVDPVILAEQYTDATNGIAPSYLKDAKSLKHAFRIDASEDLTNPNIIQTITKSDVLGNTGWFDERFNGGATNYSVTDVKYYRDATNEEIEGLELVTDDIRVEVTISNTTDTPFSNNNTQFVANFSYAPEFDTEYQNNTNNVQENFYFDRALQTVGSAAVAGDNAIMSEVSATFNSSSEIVVTLMFAMDSDMVADILTRSRKSFNIGIAIQDHTLATELADLVCLDVATEPFFVDVSDPSMVSITNTYLRHYESDPDTEGTAIVCAKIEDDGLMYSRFFIDRDGREDDTITINNVNVSIVAKKATGEEFELESYTKSFLGTQVVDDTQYIQYSEDRAFKFPDGDIRKRIYINRRTDLDTTDLRYYEVYYPFLLRWEDWVALGNVNADFFDVSEENNGQNQEWQHYDALVQWDVYFRITVNAVKNGEPLAFEEETRIEIDTYTDNADWINETITFKDSNGNVLANGGDKYINGYEDTTVEITKEWAGALTLPTTSEVHWVVGIEVEQSGGIFGKRWLSSVYDWEQYSWLKSSDGSGLVVKSESGGVHKATFVIDYTKLPENICFDVVGRIHHEGFDPVVDGKLTEAGILKLTEDNNIKLID